MQDADVQSEGWMPYRRLGQTKLGANDNDHHVQLRFGVLEALSEYRIGCGSERLLDIPVVEADLRGLGEVWQSKGTKAAR